MKRWQFRCWRYESRVNKKSKVYCHFPATNIVCVLHSINQPPHKTQFQLLEKANVPISTTRWLENTVLDSHIASKNHCLWTLISIHCHYWLTLCLWHLIISAYMNINQESQAHWVKPIWADWNPLDERWPRQPSSYKFNDSLNLIFYFIFSPSTLIRPSSSNMLYCLACIEVGHLKSVLIFVNF